MSAKETFRAFFPDWITGIVKAGILVILAQAGSVLAHDAETHSLLTAILTLGAFGLWCFLSLQLLKHVRATGDGAPDEKQQIRADYDLLIKRFFVIPSLIIGTSCVIVIFLFGASPGSAEVFGLVGMSIILALLTLAM